jgi:glyoxylase-like metal-dependent hydrolase (beta-lactamase superfamily II)
MTHRLNLVLLILVLAIGGPFYWFLIDNTGDDLPAQRIDLVELRRLAASIPGEAPYAVEVERAAFRRLPGDLLVAGSGLKRRLIGYMAFRLPVRGGKSVLIESGVTPQISAELNAEQFNLSAQGRIESEMDRAGLILVTDERPDQIGALAAHGGAALSEAAKLNAAQIATRLPWKGPKPSPQLSENAPQAVAPGIVVIPAPGSHTPGSQIIYVRMANGREVLFAGDISSFALNWIELRAGSRFLETFYVRENRAAVFAWLKALRAAKTQDPALLIVPGHDWEWLEDPANGAGVRIGFSGPN